MRTGGDVAKAIACGADAVMMGSALARAAEAPGRGWHWGHAAHHPDLPRATRVRTETVGSLEEILFGPAQTDDGSTNVFGGLRKAMPRVANHASTSGSRSRPDGSVTWAPFQCRTGIPVV